MFLEKRSKQNHVELFVHDDMLAGGVSVKQHVLCLAFTYRYHNVVLPAPHTQALTLGEPENSASHDMTGKPKVCASSKM